MRPALLTALTLAIASPGAAHVMSMSSGDLTIQGDRAHYELRMPLYEITHVAHPEQVLLDHVRFAGARMTAKECHADAPKEIYLCTADYTFAKPVDELDVECTLSSVTVPNHVHLLHAQSGTAREEAVFDAGFTRTRLRFRPQGAGEVAVTQSVAGFLRSLGGPVQILFLLAMVFAARSRRELVMMGVAFFAGQCATVALVPWTNWQPAATFVEAAAALTVAYLAMEIVLLPASGTRWLVATTLGTFHGLYFVLFVRSTGYHPALVLAGAAAGEAAAIAAFAYLLSLLGSARKPLVRLLAWMLLAFGLIWFFLRLSK
jgi:hypothetical protein